MGLTVQPVVAFPGRVVRYLSEVRAEVRKVTWPTWEELRKSTFVIIIFVIIMGLVIGAMDLIFSFILVNLLGRMFA